MCLDAWHVSKDKAARKQAYVSRRMCERFLFTFSRGFKKIAVTLMMVIANQMIGRQGDKSNFDYLDYHIFNL